MFEQKGDLRDAYILHKAIDESAIILGYFLLDNTHITSSSLFEILRQNTVNVEREKTIFHHLLMKNAYILVLGYLINN